LGGGGGFSPKNSSSCNSGNQENLKNNVRKK